MASFKPFQVIHPAPDTWQDVAALPYDVYSRAEAAAAVEGHPLSFLNIDRPETQFPPEQDMYAPEVYEAGAQRLRQEIAEGVFVREETPCCYLYELTMNGRTQSGFVGLASAQEYQSGVIRRHENTRKEKELDRIRHIEALGMQTGPIFLACRQTETLRQLSAQIRAGEPDFDFVSDDGIRHRGFKIADAALVSQITDAFGAVPVLYIADGHHRAASAVKVAQRRAEAAGGEDAADTLLSEADAPAGEAAAQTEETAPAGDAGSLMGEAGGILCVIFPDEELKILDYNRVVRDLNGLRAEEFLAMVGKKCHITEFGPDELHPACKGEVVLLLDDVWYRLSFREELRSDDPVEGLDTQILQREILGPVLGIQDPRTDKRIDFVGGIRGCGELVRRVHSDCRAAFAMYPTSMDELFAVADAGKLMPPKSTWFEPKLRSGLFLHGI